MVDIAMEVGPTPDLARMLLVVAVVIMAAHNLGLHVYLVKRPCARGVASIKPHFA